LHVFKRQAGPVIRATVLSIGNGDTIRVQQGQKRLMIVGKAYPAQQGLQPGDELENMLGRRQIKLIPLGGAEEE